MTGVVVEDLWFGYKDDDPIISGLSHRFLAGTTTAVTGPSGRGKSTLLYLIGLLLAPRSGRIDVGAHPDAGRLSDRARSRLRAAQIGFVFQDAMLDPSRTVLDNVIEGALYADVPRRIARDRGLQLLERFGVDLRSDHRPGEISGGQAQRVALCRALIKQPRVILADEPTGNLDAASSHVVLRALAESAEGSGATVVVASHDTRVVGACDGVLEL